jgi:hypothetical protein
MFARYKTAWNGHGCPASHNWPHSVQHIHPVGSSFAMNYTVDPTTFTNYWNTAFAQVYVTSVRTAEGSGRCICLTCFRVCRRRFVSTVSLLVLDWEGASQDNSVCRRPTHSSRHIRVPSVPPGRRWRADARHCHFRHGSTCDGAARDPHSHNYVGVGVIPIHNSVPTSVASHHESL